MHPVMVKYIENGSKRDSEEYSKRTTERSTHKSNDKDVERWETERTAHNQWNHDIPLELLEKYIETDNRTDAPHAHFRTHEDHQKCRNKGNNWT